MRKLLWIMLPALVALPITANAEVYKWKDKDGTVRYSDTPPPSNVEQLPVSGKKKPTPKPNAVAPEDVRDPATTPAPAAPAADAKKKPTANSDEDALKRQQDAETEKKKAEQKEAEQKAKQQNCSNAKASLNTYKQGGRIRKMNENGEREYLGDADIAAGLEQAQKDVSEFCE